jgi:hypothetical protein
VAMVMLTTLATPPLLKAVFANEPGGSKSRQTRLFPELGRGPKSAAATRRSPRSESRDY